MPRESLKCLQGASFLNCKCFSKVPRRLVYRRLMQNHDPADPAVEIAKVLKLEVVGVGHSDGFPPYEATRFHFEKPSVESSMDARK